MTTNKYWMLPGVNRPSKTDVSKAYVDNKFTILTGDLNTKMDKIGGNSKINSKVSKNGDVMTGILNLGVNAIKTTHTPLTDDDVITKKYFDELIARRLNDDDMKIIENRLSLKVNLTGDEMSGAIRMGNNKITSTRVPEDDDELVNKRYLNTRFVKNNVGYIPDMAKSNAQSGFVSSASSEYQLNTSFFPFCSWNGSWRTNSNEGMWIQIKCPENVRVYKFALRGVPDRSARIYNWQLEASSDGTRWVILYSVVNKYIGDATEFMDVNTANPPWAKFYKLVVTEAEGTNPGISYWQLFTLDQVVNLYP